MRLRPFAGIAIVAASVRLRPDDGWINGTVGGVALVVLAVGTSAAILLNLVVPHHDEVRTREFAWCWLRHTVVRRGDGVEMRLRSPRVSGTMVRVRRGELRWPGRRRKRTIGLNTYSAVAQRQIVARLQELATRR